MELHYEAYITHEDGSTETITSSQDLQEVIRENLVGIMNCKVKIDEWENGINKPVEDLGFWMLDFFLMECGQIPQGVREEILDLELDWESDEED